MNEHLPPEIEMRPDGSFVDPPTVPWSVRILRVAIILAVLSAALAGAILLIGFALFLIPVAIGAAVVAWAAFRYRLWKVSRSAGGTRNIFRP